jgi:regulatory protein
MIRLTPQQARDKILRYCAYQERSHSEVKNKLYEFGLKRDEVDELLTYLITEGFLNEERFAKAFAGGKFRMKKWGRLKIIHALEGKNISKNCIKSAMKEIDEDEYREALRKIISDKSEMLDSENVYVLRDKIAKYAMQKGYEPELLWQVLKEVIPDR